MIELNLNKSFQKMKNSTIPLGWPKSETGDSFAPSLPVVHRLIPAITSDEARQGGLWGHEATVGDSP
jgi:hypothetical protein